MMTFIFKEIYIFPKILQMFQLIWKEFVFIPFFWAATQYTELQNIMDITYGYIRIKIGSYPKSIEALIIGGTKNRKAQR